MKRRLTSAPILIVPDRGQGYIVYCDASRDRVHSGTGDEGWTVHSDGSLWYRGRVVVPHSTDLRKEILRQFHCSRFSVHPGGTKMYQDLRRQY